MIDKRIACNTSCVMVRLCETSVNNHQHTVCFDGILTLTGMNRDMTVNDVASLSFNSETVKNASTNGRIFAKLIVSTFFFMMRGWIGEEISLERRHSALVEEWTVWSAPKIPEEISRFESLLSRCVVLECSTHFHLDCLHQIATLIRLSVNFDLSQTPVSIERNGSMVEEITVANSIHRSMTEEQSDMFLKLFGNAEGVVESFDEFFFLLSQFVGVVFVKSGEEGVEQRIVFSVETIGSLTEVDVLQSTPSVNVPLRMLLDELSF